MFTFTARASTTRTLYPAITRKVPRRRLDYQQGTLKYDQGELYQGCSLIVTKAVNKECFVLE